MNNFTLRAISGFFYAIAVIGCILLSPATLAILMFVIAFFCAFEWARIHDASKPSAMGFGLYTWLFLSPFVTVLSPLQAAGIAAIIALIDDRSRVREAAIRALAIAATKTWDAVWDTLVADYLRLHRPALR